MSEKRIIDANALLTHECEADKMGAMLVVGKGYILDAPTVPAEAVCHCRNCKFCECDEISKTGRCTCPNRDIFANDTEAFEAVTFDDYCSYGERRESEVEK